MTYTINQGGGIVRDSDGAYIPTDPANSDYADYLAWVAAGNTATVPVPSLAEVQAKQKLLIDASYAAAAQTNVSFTTAAGVAKTYQADQESQMVLMQATQGYQIAGGVPDGFFWKAADNTLTAFTMADLEGLYMAMLAQGWAAFQKRTALKSQIDAATSPDAVQAIVWG